MIETKFKNTEIGRIPEDWEVKSIESITDVVTGATPSTSIPEYWGGNIRWMSSGELNDKFIYDVEGRITELGYANAGTHMLPVHCVLIGLAGQGKTRGTAAYNFVELCTNQSIGAILPHKSYDSLYLYYYINSLYTYLRMLSSGDGGRGGLNKNLLLQLQIPFPPTKEEQSRIASALFDIDTLIRDLDRTIEKKQNIRQGAMEQLLSGKSDWVECELSEIINVVKGVQLNGSELLEDGPYPMINGGIEPSGYTTNFNRNAETITISEGGNSCGYVNFIHQKFWAGGHCYCVVIRKNVEIEKDFLYHLLKNNEKAIMAMRVGSGLPNVQSKTLLAMRVSYPADIKEQRAIADSLTAMDDEIAMLQLERTKYANIRSGMMDDLLSGTKRL